MKKHLLCLTVDTDPDGLNAQCPDRKSLDWRGLEYARCLPDEIARHVPSQNFPITWFIRADGQLESMLGSAAYLLDNYEAVWANVQRNGHELAWHPHLYRQARAQDPAVIISNPTEAADELERLWGLVKDHFQPTAFRNGEGWHVPETYDAVERLGFSCDSTAIPGRKGPEGHPMNWEGAPNQPYFPSPSDLSMAGARRPLLELPMNSWLVQAPYDAVPKTRYMNPALHPRLYESALKGWEDACKASIGLSVWVLILHPEEILPSRGPDALYAGSISDLCKNLASMIHILKRLGHKFDWVTISTAAEQWRALQENPVA